MTAEEEVRGAWEWIVVRKRDDRSEWEWFGSLCWQRTAHLADNETQAWQAALDFTHKRKQEIAEIEEEMEYVQSFAWLPRRNGKREEHPVWQRILRKLTAQRDELKKGLRD